MEFHPHGMCFLWKSNLIAAYTIANLGIACAYLLGFPSAVLIALGGWRALPNPLLLSLLAFVAFCGLGHAIDVWNVWNANYWVETVWHFGTLVASWLFVLISGYYLSTIKRLERDRTPE